MPYKDEEERRAYARKFQREYVHRRKAADPEYAAYEKAKLQARRAAGYFREYQKRKREERGAEGRANEAAAARAWRAANREKARAVNRKAKAKQKLKYPNLAREKWLKHQYGITLADYERLLAEQDGRCAICQKLPMQVRLAVDHVHGERKIVRGLLCSHCNVALGLIGDDVKWTERAAEYLRKHKQNGRA